MSWQDVLKKKLIVNDVVNEIGSVLVGYENMDKESTAELLYDYQYHEIKDIYDTLEFEPHSTSVVTKPSTYEYMIQCNVYDEKRKENYTGVLFSTYLDADTDETEEFIQLLERLSFKDELKDAKEFMESRYDFD
jgi:hypothetical protein